MGKDKEERRNDYGKAWWVERYIRMSKAERRRANNGGSRAYSERGKKKGKYWEI